MCNIDKCNQCDKEGIYRVDILDDEGEDQGVEWYCEEHKPNFLKTKNDF